MQQQNIQAQSQANAQAAQASSQAKMQEQQAITQSKMQLEQMKGQMEAQKLQQEAMLKKELMALEFQYNMQLKGVESQGLQQRDAEKEDRKDKRTKIQASQQSELIEQRKSNKPAKNFESSGNDLMSGGFNIDKFGPAK